LALSFLEQLKSLLNLQRFTLTKGPTPDQCRCHVRMSAQINLRSHTNNGEGLVNINVKVGKGYNRQNTCVKIQQSQLDLHITALSATRDENCILTADKTGGAFVADLERPQWLHVAQFFRDGGMHNKNGIRRQQMGFKDPKLNKKECTKLGWPSLET